MVKDLNLTETEMRDLGYRVVDTLVTHFNELPQKKPVALGTRKEMDFLFLEEAPQGATQVNDVLDFVVKNVFTNTNLVTHPKSYAFVPGPSNYVSVMADTLATGFNTFSGGWNASPAASELEIVTINWLLKMFGLPPKKGGGLFTSGGSVANLTALVTARNKMCGEDFSKARIYLSDQAHSSNVKAIRIMGLKKEQIRIIPTDSEYRFSVNKLKNAIARDRLEGYVPFCVIASAGTTNTGTVDPLQEIAIICKEEKIWFHIDAAYGGAAILSQQGKKLLKGIQKADSITVDPHKWFYQPYEMGCLLVRDHSWLKNTFIEKPEYLRDIEGNESEINFYDMGMQLTRRFRALKLFMSIKTFGLDAFAKAITYNIELAEIVERLLRESSRWEVISSASLAIINFRYNPISLELSEKEIDELNQHIASKVTESREAILATTILNGQVVLRMCLINPRTTIDDVKETLLQCESFASLKLENVFSV
ncbi:pyridoxal phosphate-dependent decarboxylase family protein [Winogradskyella jejuensis]|uniref:Glutamate or tyrosine decarboxylase n=1 Tax=Winogradskyella jejuensis TaxID=1089305 RepID=A0A1M5KU22_9FLAO|nr:aspartate aminotransferase family protein [Winogradskyella jejuensis]SHG56019.1 Glutamate or tyrosine decarboxylase [Winogradskyella jejuensis]